MPSASSSNSPGGLLPGSVDPKQHPAEISVRRNRFVDAARLCIEVRIVGADDDSSVRCGLLMQADEVLAVEGEDAPTLCRGELKDFLVGDAAPGITCLVAGQYIVPEPPEFLNHLARKVLV
jgi:hypothetical protein